MKKFYLQLYRHTLPAAEDNVWVSIESLDIHADTIQVLAELGIVEVHQGYIQESEVRRLQKLLSLRRNLGVNIPGASIILDLLERVER
ncbi:MAG: chaperone modulator CbpM, partial [Desulfocucumaceae bacterium]